VGAARSELAPYATFMVWVNTDPQIAEDRRIARDLATGVNGNTQEKVVEFEKDWMANEVPFHLLDKPWERAHLIVQPQGGGEVVGLFPIRTNAGISAATSV
jgi:hypothetical protein